MESLTVADLTFEVRRSPRRKTVEITVDRGGELVLAAPEGVAESVMTDFVEEKAFWIYTKLAEKAALQHPIKVREYVDGEGFLYLGRSYRLLLVDEQSSPVKLEAGRFRMRRELAERGRGEMLAWYTSHARTWLRRRVELWADRIGVEPAGVAVRDLGYRWGSCGESRVVNFHWATILLPGSMAEYVVVHELVHLLEPNHTPEFWLAVERALPEFKARKQWLARKGGEYASL